MDVVSLTRKLIAFNSVTSESNLPLGAFLQAHLEQLGFATEVQRQVDGQGVAKVNLIGRRAAQDGRLAGGLLLAGHMDTVPFRADQKATLSPILEGNRLYGRGACDMKGGIAAQLTAAAQVVGKPLRAPLEASFTFDEEIGCLGAKALLGTGLLRSRHAIVAEPSELKPIRLHKGYCAAQVTVTGRPCHSSDPWRGVSALKAAAEGLLALAEVEASLASQPYTCAPGLFDPDCATLNVGLFQAGSAINVVPETARFSVELRPLPGQDPRALYARIEAVLRQTVEKRGASLDFHIQWMDVPMDTPADADLVTLLETLSGAQAGAVSYSAEGREYNLMGMQSVILGPGSIQQAHQEDEYVPLEDLEVASSHYARAIEHFCL